MGRLDILLVGHRGTGKSTVARAMAQNGWPVVDLDDAIEAQTGHSPAQLVARDEASFRAIEARTLAALCGDAFDGARVIVLGAGCLTLPDHALVVWLNRRGWEHTARAERARLRPEWSFDTEVAWMRETREPIWKSRANLYINIPAGRTAERVARELSDLLRWAQAGGAVPAKTWLIANGSSAHMDFLVAALGLRGVEIRSDLCPIPPPALTSPCLASLRHSDPDWLRQTAHAQAFDVDVRFLVQALPVLGALPARTLIVSSHPDSDTPASLAEATWLATQSLPTWRIESKVAGPFGPDTLAQLRADTRLPTTPVMRGWRALLAFENAQNYITSGIREDRFGGPPGVPPMDLLDWLPYFGLPSDVPRAAVVGADVSESQGAWWHRSQEERSGRSLAYFRVDTASQTLAQSADRLRSRGINAISVTSPLKAEAAQLCGSDLPALNTLRHTTRWEGTDTDELGMHAMIGHVGPDESVLVVGTGAVAHAVMRALGSRPNVIHLPGRHTGQWPTCDVVVNTTGHGLHAMPTPRLWMDLGYANTEPVDAEVHLNGDEFFDAQAHGQRRFWGWSD